ncbi:MAG: gliding motility-associated C-terminal domain-containing protein [Cryomorphaceae bacterium]
MLRKLSLILMLHTVFYTVSHGQYWMQRGGSLNVDEGLDVVVDNSGNTYVTGYFSATADFGNTNLTSNGSTDIFVAKMDDDGVYLWAVKAGGSGTDRGLSIALDDSNNVVITGYFNGTASFGSASLTSAGQQDIFIAKYSTSGALQWAKRAGGTASDIGSGIAVDNGNNIVVTGEFKGLSTFGTTSLNSQNASTDVFITKLNPGGSFAWTQQGAGDQTDRGVDIGCDGSGNIYAVGQFSDTFTFDQVHNNQMFNALYVAKFNSSGVEQWFRIIGGGVSAFAHSMDVRSTGDVFIGGDFTGNLIFYNTSNTTLTNAYDNGIFVAKYSSSGATVWAKKSGSDSPITCRGVAADGSGNVYAVGQFECTFDEYADEYGEANFRNIGYGDIFLTKFSSNGSFGWSRHIGSTKADIGHGVDAGPTGKAHFTGSFQTNLVVPTSSNFLSSNLSNWNESECANNDGYCNDPSYGTFHLIPSDGNSDVVVANCFDPNRAPLDYFIRSGSGCVKNVLDICINNGCPDTVTACSSVLLTSQTKTCPQIDPDYWYQWMGNQNTPQAIYNNQGNKWLRIKSKDLCYADTDTVFVKILDKPEKPYISDDVVVNNPTPVPIKIDVCVPDTVQLTGSNITTDSFRWESAVLPPGGIADSIIEVTETGTYIFYVVNEDGCEHSSQVDVEFFEPLDSFLLRVWVDDTIAICDNENFMIQLYDSIDNPNHSQICFTDSQPYISSIWSYTPSSWVTNELCKTFLMVSPQDTGWFHFEATIIRYIPCDTDTFLVSDSVYVIPIPSPEPPANTVNMIGSLYFCPGSTCLQYGSGGGGSGTYTWTGQFVNGLDTDSVWIGVPGFYSVYSTVYDTNQYGCIDSTTAGETKYISEKPQPQISASSLLICPNDSVWITAYNTGAVTGFFWEGPNGPIAADTSSIMATEPGTYYCVVNDSDSCDLTSNSIILSQYTTPSLEAGADVVICDGDSLVLSVVSNAGSEIEWLPPLSGNGLQQTVTEPGVYTCKITSCGIETYASIEVFPSYVESEITFEGVLCLDSFMVLYGTDSMFTYAWNMSNSGADSIVISQPGTYVLTTTDSNGCEKISDPVTIEIDQEPTAISIDGYPVLCEFDTMTLYGNSNMVLYHWSTGDSTQNIEITDDGTYLLWAKDSNGCRGLSEPIKITTPDTIARYDIEGDLAFCEGDSVVFRARKKGMAQYLWLPDSATGRTIIFDSTGTYWLLTTDTFGCNAWSDTVNVYMQPNEIDKPITRDTIVCETRHAPLYVQHNIGTLKWSERPYGRVFHEGPFYLTDALIAPVTYYVWSDFELCRGDTSSVHVATMDCFNAMVPNVFTPNGDGNNDRFFILLNEITCFHIYIYNRWGILLYEGHSIDEGWDGNIQGTERQAPEGTYYYLIDYCRHDASEGTAKGFVTLLRE